MFDLLITSTGKSFSPRSSYFIFDERRKAGFSSMKEIYAWLRETYGKAKRQAQFTDRKDGKTYRSGWVIGFRNADYSHAPVDHWLQQDWITVVKVEAVAL